MGPRWDDVGFWKSLSKLRLGELWPEGLLAAAISAGISVGLLWRGDEAARYVTSGDYLLISGALVGVVIAGFALVVSLMSDKYAVWLDGQGDGVRAFLQPFMVGVGLQIGALLAAVVYRALASLLPRHAEEAGFIIASFLFCYAALDVVALGRNVMAHGLTKAEAATIAALEERVERAMRNDVRRGTTDN